MTMTTKTGMVLEDTSIEFGSTADAASPALSQFPASDVQLDVPNWGMAVVVAVLLAVFAAVVQEDVAMDGPKKTVSLVRIDAIAWRLSCAAAAASLYFAASSAVQDMSWVPSFEFGSAADAASPALSQFPASDVQVDVPNWGLAVVAAVLLAVFAAVVQEDVAMDS